MSDPRLDWLDRLIQREINRLRARYAVSLDEFRGLYVSDEQADALQRPRPPDGTPPPRPPPMPGSRWALLAARFGLDPLEEDLLLIAVAPELDRRYETLYAYLNNHVEQRWPTLDLAARLLDDGPAVRWALSAGARLRRRGLIGLVAETQRRPELARQLAIAPAAARWLLGLDAAAPELRLHAGWPGDAGPLDGVLHLRPTERLPLLLLEALPGAGRLQAVCALAHTARRAVLEIDLAAAARPMDELLNEAALVARLENALVLLRLADAPAAEPVPAAVLDGLPPPVLIALAPGASLPMAWLEREVVRIPWPQPGPAERRALWHDALAEAEIDADAAVLDDIAERFQLTPRQIGRAARLVALRQQLTGGAQQALAPADLFRAAREQSGDALLGLAVRVSRPVVWDDLILPPATLARLRDIAAAIANRGLVQRTWGMGRLSLSPDGLAVLFQGASGTGKTMAASAIASALGLELYRIDLAGLVSKYIGETEKNIDRIFRAARRSNAVLLFDEADALFGKRSEVKDSHDRHANIEVSYLLQRLEEHDGPVILATNLAKNMDQAFARRLHYVVEFPRPDQPARQALWRQMLAPPLPCAADVDAERLARQFELTGGEIRRTALEAAFTAAADDRVVTMAQLEAAASRELQRQGRIVSSRGGAARVGRVVA